MRIWVDDVRVDTPRADIVFRNAEDALRLTPWKEVSELTLDHDLGEDRMSGYDLLKLLAGLGWIPPIVVFVSSNPVGRANFRGVLEQNGYSMHYDPNRDYMETWTKE